MAIFPIISDVTKLYCADYIFYRESDKVYLLFITDCLKYIMDSKINGYDYNSVKLLFQGILIIEKKGDETRIDFEQEIARVDAIKINTFIKDDAVLLHHHSQRINLEQEKNWGIQHHYAF